MADTPHFLNSLDVDPAEPDSDDSWAVGPEARYARFGADDAALLKESARDSVRDARHGARMSQIYYDSARSSADQANIHAGAAGRSAGDARLAVETAEISADRSHTAATSAHLSAEIANRAAQSASSARHLAYTLTMFVLGLSLGFMLAILIYLWVVTTARDVAPLAPALTPYHGATPTAPHQLKPAS